MGGQTFCYRPEDVFSVLRPRWCLSQLLNAAILTWKQPWTQLQEWAWLCASKTIWPLGRRVGPWCNVTWDSCSEEPLGAPGCHGCANLRRLWRLQGQEQLNSSQHRFSEHLLCAGLTAEPEARGAGMINLLQSGRVWGHFEAHRQPLSVFFVPV